ncbi:MAG: hypothetical protein WBH60_03010, partial [Fervidobacterium sp.]
ISLKSPLLSGEVMLQYSERKIIWYCSMVREWLEKRTIDDNTASPPIEDIDSTIKFLNYTTFYL